MRNKVIVFVALLVFAVIIMLPPIIHGYIYPNIGDDTAAHMNIFDYVGIFAPEDIVGEQIRYGAIYIIGYPLDFASHVFNVDNDILFMWFNFLALFGVGITLFFIFKDLLGLGAGLLALLIPIFTSYSMLLLFYSGVIFEIINIGIILPLAVYCTIKWLMTKRTRFAIGATGLFLLFAVFHSTGVYLPFMAVVGIIAFIVYKLVKRQTISKRFLWVVVVACAITLLMLISPILENIQQTMAMPSFGMSGIPLLQEVIVRYITYFVLVILVVSIIFMVGEYKQLRGVEKLTVLAFSILSVIMLPAILFGWSPQPFRQGIGFAIFISLIAVALLSIVMRLDKKHMVTMLLLCLAVVGAGINIANWFGYNSALEGVDIEAIHYINTLPGDSYSCADNIDPWIYSRYVEKEYLASSGEILVIRNIPMKSKVRLIEEGDLTSSRVFLGKFVDGSVEIEVYK